MADDAMNADWSSVLSAWAEGQKLTKDESEHIRQSVLGHERDCRAIRMTILMDQIQRSVQRSERQLHQQLSKLAIKSKIVCKFPQLELVT